ncbi:MAG: hypothetical protein MJA29_11490 [Candidatus Omnitrophica bacterium]|nr:hypothetical protein [Candidatus Omnitrophota bacterium]
MTIEILKLIASFLTPLIVLVLGVLINKNIAKEKISLLQEKEWQVRWAETFLIRAIKFDENISVVINSLFRLQEEAQNQNKGDTEKNEKKLLKTINQSIANIGYLNWDIQNFTQFAKDGKDVVCKQKELMEALKNIFAKKQGDVEKIRQIQFEYNKVVRKAHNQILNAKV